VHDVALVHVVDGRQQLFHELSGVHLAEVVVLFYRVEELAASAVLDHHVVEVFVVEDFVEFYYVWVVECFQQFELAE
jgi:hypothetical protein